MIEQPAIATLGDDGNTSLSKIFAKLASPDRHPRRAYTRKEKLRRGGPGRPPVPPISR
ncbi:MAG TPA: hypothetical protein VGC59_11760 [Solirubrobacteraceae bacterium]